MEKRISRLRRAKRGRKHMKKLGVPRLCVHRTPRHMYASVILEEENGSKIVASASTLHKSLRSALDGNKTEQASIVGKHVAEAAKSAGITKVSFDRSGFKYHGRVKALADAAREAGLDF